MKHFTTVEQSKKLLELGLNPESADMYYEPSAGFGTEPSEISVGDIKYAHPRSVPCWSLGALLEVIPKQLEKQKYWKTLLVNIESNRDVVSYVNYSDESSLYDAIGDTPKEAAYNMVVWLLENGYIKKMKRHEAVV